MMTCFERIRYSMLIGILRRIGRRNMSTPAIEHPVRKKQLQKIRWVFNKHSIDEMEVSGHRVFTFSTKEASRSLHLIYFHGGAYIWQGDFIHWIFIRNLMRRLDCRASYMDYPLAPEHGYRETFTMVRKAFESLVKAYPDDEFVFLGDSAGAGLALAFAQELNLEKFPKQPHKMILISPWLDLNLNNQQIKQMETQDPILSVKALSLAADLYAKGSNKSIYRLSPINGEIAGLGEIHIFIGTRDILWPDCLKFFETSRKIHKDIYLHEYKNMPHTWIFFPFSQTKDAITRIFTILMEIR